MRSPTTSLRLSPRPLAGRSAPPSSFGARRSVADAAREAFVHAMSRASIVAAVVAALGAFIAWRYLPARETDASAERSPDGLGERELATAGAGPGELQLRQ